MTLIRLLTLALVLKFWELFFDVVSLDPFQVDLDVVFLLRVPQLGYSFDWQLLVLFGSHICFLVYHDIKHGAILSRRQVLHHVYSYTRNHYKTNKLVRRLKYRQS